MSWQVYVDTNLVGSGWFAKAAIVGENGSVYASSAGFTISADEARAITQGFKDEAGLQALQGGGIRAGGTKYFYTSKPSDRSIYGKKQTDGVLLVKTKTLVLVGVYLAPVQAPEAAKVIEPLADYLIQQGF